MPDSYRLAASVVLLRPVTSSDGQTHYQLFLIHKPRKKDAWQLPQGGREENESIEEAALRELKEEAGIDDVTVLGASREVYQYDFPQSFRRYRPDTICGQRIAFIFAVAPADVPVCVDNKEIDGYTWVDIKDLRRYVKRSAYRDLITRLYNESLTYLRPAT